MEIIIVMWQVVEVGSPSGLLSGSDGSFSSLLYGLGSLMQSNEYVESSSNEHSGS